MTARKAAKEPEGRTRLLAAGAELFAMHGYAGASTQAICDRAGVTKPVLYWHFDSKEGLYGEVLRSISEDLIAEIRSSTEGASDPAERLTLLVDAWRGLVLQESPMLRLQVMAAFEAGGAEDGNEGLRALALSMWDQATAALVDGTAQAIGKDHPRARVLAEVVLSLLEHAMIRFTLSRDRKELDRLLGDIPTVATALLLAPD